MPNGEYVNVPDNITPEGRARLEKAYSAPATRTSATPPRAATPRDRIAERRRIREEEDRKERELYKTRDDGPLSGMVKPLRSLARGVTFGADELAEAGVVAGVGGGIRAIARQDIGEIPRVFNNVRQAQREMREAREAEAPVTSAAAEITGAVLNPVGASLGIAKGLSTGAKALQRVAPAAKPTIEATRAAIAALKASKAGRATGAIVNSAPALGARAGLNQGVISAAIDGKAPDAIASEGLQGAVLGGAAGGALRLGGGVVNALAKRGEKAAPHVAYERMARMLERSDNPATGRPFTPDEVANEVKAARAGGTPYMTADVLDDGQDFLSYLSKQTGLKAASHVRNEAEERLADAGGRFESKVRKVLGIGSEDAYATGKAIKADRRAAGDRDFSPEVMDRQLAWSDKLENIFTRDDPKFQKIVREAADDIKFDEEDIAQQVFSKGFLAGEPGALTFAQAPSIRVMDAVKSKLNSKISTALSGNKPDVDEARRLSRKITQLKEAIAEVNPEYGQALLNQRDFFQRTESLELGQKALDMIKRKEARELMDLISDPKVKSDDLKLGFADALMALSAKENPVALLRRAAKTPDQRKALVKLFGSEKKFADFERFMRRELRARDTDLPIIASRRMQKDLLRDPPPENAGEAVKSAAQSLGTGYAFGGPIGAASRVARDLTMREKTISTAAKEQLAKALSDDASGLKKGVNRSKAYMRILERKAKRRAVSGSKGVVSFAGGNTGYEE
jgi:hypothetical protein